MKAKISAQLILAVAAISLVVFGLLSLFLLRELKGAQVEQVGEHGRQLAKTIRSSTRYAMLHNRREDVEQIVSAIGAQADILDVRIFNKEGRVVYSGNPTQVGSMVDRISTACKGCHDTDSPAEALAAERGLRRFRDARGQSVLGVIEPIYNEPGCASAACHAHPPDQAVLGVLDVTMSLEAIERQMAKSRAKSLSLTAAAILAIGTVIGLFLHFRVGKPVARLVEATRNVADGDLSYRLEIERDDEMGDLERSFNEMTRQLAETQTQLYQSNKLASVGRLAAGIAHEINNPLTGILSFSSLLLRSAGEADSQTKSDLETIVRETKRCREIVRGLLDFSRQVPPRKTAVDVADIAHRSLDIVDHEFEVRGIHVTTAVSDPMPMLRLDANQMIQVLLNLLVNAADATGAQGGEIFLGAKLEVLDGKRYLELKVADNGCGIPPENLDKIFDPFFTTKEGNGTGLGLAVVWGIVQEHGGTVAAYSRPEQGTTFTVHLPVDVDGSGAGDRASGHERAA